MKIFTDETAFREFVDGVLDKHGIIPLDDNSRDEFISYISMGLWVLPNDTPQSQMERWESQIVRAALFKDFSGWSFMTRNEAMKIVGQMGGTYSVAA